MPVKLNTIPGPASRPARPKPLRWLSALICLIAAGILLMRFLGRLVGETSFWWFAIGVPAVFWSTLMGFRLAVYMMQQIQANAWDQRREQVILQEVRRGRRALQILFADCSTAHSADQQFVAITDALLNNENKLFSQTSWQKEKGVRHSRLPIAENMSKEELISASFDHLLKNLTKQFSHLSSENPVAILFESCSSLPKERVQAIWLQAWQTSGICQPMTFLSGQGLDVIDHWLDHRIKDTALLLVIALQIAPEQSESTAEAVVGLLLGNRLTQKTLMPVGLLHRPEASPPQSEVLQSAVIQAADWVPLKTPNALQHLWLAGLAEGSEAYQCAVVAQSNAPLANIDRHFGVHNFNEFLGDPGCAAPWLAIAAAAQAISQSPAPHMIISGEQDSDTVWTTVVSPTASHKENKA